MLQLPLEKNTETIVVAGGLAVTTKHTKVSPAPSHPALWIYRVPDTYTRCDLALGDILREPDLGFLRHPTGTRSRVPETSLNGQTLRHTEQTQSIHLATCTQQLRACGRNMEPVNSHKLCPRPRHVLPANDSSSLPSSPNAITDYYQMSTGMRKGVSPMCLPVQLERITPAKVECRSWPPSADSLQYTTVLDSDCLPVLGKLRKDSALPHCTTVLHYHTERRHRTTTQQGHTALLHYDDALLCHTASSHCTATMHYPWLVYVCAGSQTRALLTPNHSSTEQCSAAQSSAGQSSAAQGRVAQHRAEQSRAEQNSAEQRNALLVRAQSSCQSTSSNVAVEFSNPIVPPGSDSCGVLGEGQRLRKRQSEQSRGGHLRAEQCRAVQDRAMQDRAVQRSAAQSRVKQCSEGTTVNCNGDSLQCSPAVSLTRPMCGALPVLPVASEKSSAVQGRAEQCRAEKNSEHQKVVSPTHLRSFNSYSVQSFIILFSFYSLLCTKLPSPSSRVAKCKPNLANFKRNRKRRIGNDIETKQNLNNKLNEHKK